MAEGCVARGTGILEAGGPDRRQAEEGGGQRSHVQLALALAPGDIAIVERLDRRRGDVRVMDGVGRRLGEELGADALVLPELGHSYPDHGNATHSASPAYGSRTQHSPHRPRAEGESRVSGRAR